MTEITSQNFLFKTGGMVHFDVSIPRVGGPFNIFAVAVGEHSGELVFDREKFGDGGGWYDLSEGAIGG